MKACGSLWKTRSVFQGAVDAMCASTGAGSFHCASRAAMISRSAPVESAVLDLCREHLRETCASTGPP